MRVQIGEIVDLRRCRSQHLLHGGKICDDLVDLIRSDPADHTGRSVVEQISYCWSCCSASTSTSAGSRVCVMVGAVGAGVGVCIGVAMGGRLRGRYDGIIGPAI